jgi:hypothetical protein
VIQIGNAMGKLYRMVVRQQMPEGAKPNLFGHQQSLGDQKIRSRAWLPPCRKVFSNPCLLEAQRI